jgi:hypothetical protein
MIRSEYKEIKSEKLKNKNKRDDPINWVLKTQIEDYC